MAAGKVSAHSDVNQSRQMSARRGKPVQSLIAGVHQGGAYVGDALKDVPSSEEDIVDTDRLREKRKILQNKLEKIVNKIPDPFLRHELTLLEKMNMALKIKITREMQGHSEKHIDLVHDNVKRPDS